MAICDIPNRSEYDSSGVLTVIMKIMDGIQNHQTIWLMVSVAVLGSYK